MTKDVAFQSRRDFFGTACMYCRCVGGFGCNWRCHLVCEMLRNARLNMWVWQFASTLLNGTMVTRHFTARNFRTPTRYTCVHLLRRLSVHVYRRTDRHTDPCHAQQPSDFCYASHSIKGETSLSCKGVCNSASVMWGVSFVKLEPHGTDTDTDTDIRDAPIV